MKNTNILIIKYGSLGDVLRTTSFLKGLRSKYKRSDIYWLTSPEAEKIIINNHLIKHVLVYSDKIAGYLLSKNFDLVISLDDDIGLCKLASILKTKRLIGSFWNKKDFVSYTDELKDYFDMGLISRYGRSKADKLKKLNKKTYQDIISEGLKIKKSAPILQINKRSLIFADRFSKIHDLGKKIIIGLNTGAGKRWERKKLSEAKTAFLSDLLVKELNADVIIFGGRDEIKRNKEIKKLAKMPIIDAGNDNSLMDFAALVNLCDILVTSDSLALHIGVALKKYVIAFFGPTSHYEIDLFGKGEKIITRLKCLCCYKNKCAKNPNCMDYVRAERILVSAKRYLYSFMK